MRDQFFWDMTLRHKMFWLMTFRQKPNNGHVFKDNKSHDGRPLMARSLRCLQTSETKYPVIKLRTTEVFPLELAVYLMFSPSLSLSLCLPLSQFCAFCASYDSWNWETKFLNALLSFTTSACRGYTVAQLVEALRYKQEGRGFDSRWSHWNFSVT